MRRLAWGPCLFAVFMLLACGAAGETSEEVKTESEPEGGTSVDLSTSTTSTFPTSAPPAASAGLAESYVAPAGWRVSRQLAIDAAILDEDGFSIEVSLTGGPHGEPADPCARNYELVFSETETKVRLVLFELEPSAPDEVPQNHVCTSGGHGWRLVATLDKPLGPRALIDEWTGAPAPLVDQAGVLQPEYVPVGWVAQPPQVYNGQLERWYTHPERGPAFIYVLSVPVSEVSNLGSIRARDLVRIEEITVRSVPAIVVTSLEDGAVTLAWEEQEHLYQVHGYLVDSAELKAMAESMSR